jgi:hypothetical protein
MNLRSISHSEASTALDCQQKHSFGYTGVLTGGDALNPKTVAPQLREGRAWGRAVAAWHEHAGQLDATEHAVTALAIALSLDAAEQQQHGVFDEDAYETLKRQMTGLLGDYIAHAEPLPLTRPEYELNVAIPSRTGIRLSNRYHLQCFLDGVHTDDQDRDWIVEFKLRGRLQSFEQISLSRQLRWYAWAWREHTGRSIAGMIVDERLNEIPSEVRFNQNGAPSKVQSCRPDTYQAACSHPDPDVLAKLQAKRWEQRHVLLLLDGELDEAGWQLASTAYLIQQLDTGRLYPVRNPSPVRCPGCAYREICGNPHDTELVDALYERRPAKRERKDVPNAVAIR